MSHKWTEAERDFIREKYMHWSAARIAKSLELRTHQVQGQCKLMGLKKVTQKNLLPEKRS